MKDVISTIEELQALVRKHRNSGLNELTTRTMFIDKLLGSLGWDVADPAEVELEYTTIDGKAVDYALKIDSKPVIFVEAKALDNQLTDVKAITQVVGYAANGGVNWCVLTNGVNYKVYSSRETAEARKKLLFEISIDPDHKDGNRAGQIASSVGRLARDRVGLLDQLGEEIFTTAKVREALDRLVIEQDSALVNAIRRTLDDSNIAPAQIRAALTRIRGIPVLPAVQPVIPPTKGAGKREVAVASRGQDIGEHSHVAGKPAEVIDVYRGLDRMCLEIAPTQVSRRHLIKHIAWIVGKTTFCSAHLLQSGLKVWLNIEPSDIPAGTSFARDVSKVGHWGVGKVELHIASPSTLRSAQPLIALAFQKCASKIAQP